MKSQNTRFLLIALILVLAVVIGILALTGAQNWFGIWLAAAGVVAFAFFGYDKMQAKRGAWRVPEIVLHVLSLAGGFIGATLGMLVFRHKIRKSVFWIVQAVSSAIWVFVFTQFIM